MSWSRKTDAFCYSVLCDLSMWPSPLSVGLEAVFSIFFYSFTTFDRNFNINFNESNIILLRIEPLNNALGSGFQIVIYIGGNFKADKKGYMKKKLIFQKIFWNRPVHFVHMFRVCTRSSMKESWSMTDFLTWRYSMTWSELAKEIETTEKWDQLRKTVFMRKKS